MLYSYSTIYYQIVTIFGSTHSLNYLFTILAQSPDPVVLQMLLKHHPAVSDLTVAVQIKDLKKTLRTICLFKHLRQLGLHVKGGSQVS